MDLTQSGSITSAFVPSGEEGDRSRSEETSVATLDSTINCAEVVAQGESYIADSNIKLPNRKRGRPPKEQSSSPARKLTKQYFLLPQLRTTAWAKFAKLYPGPAAA